MLYNFNESTVRSLLNKARKEKYNFDAVNYRNRIELTYKVTDIDNISTPQWSHITKISKQKESYFITIVVFNDPNWLYDVKIALKHNFITINQ